MLLSQLPMVWCLRLSSLYSNHKPPQKKIISLYATQEHPVAILMEKVEIRSMMCSFLSYGHKVIDGKDTVTFLVKVKEVIEDI